MNKALGIAGVVVLAVIGLAFWMHGNARFAEGKAICIATLNVKAAESAKQSAKDLEKTHNETQKMSTDAIDVDLNRLGIMRSENDR